MMSIEVSGSSGPRIGDDAWDEFADGDEEVWYEAFETKMEDGEEVIDVDHYEAFHSVEEIVNYVMAASEFYDLNSFGMTEEDMQDQKREFRQLTGPRCPECLEDIQKYLSQGAMRSEVNKDPHMDSHTYVDSDDAQYKHGAEEKKVGVYQTECYEHPEVWLMYSERWYEEKEE